MRKTQFDPTTELNQTTPKEGNNQNKKKVVVKMATGFGTQKLITNIEILCNELVSSGYNILTVKSNGLIVAVLKE